RPGTRAAPSPEPGLDPAAPESPAPRHPLPLATMRAVRAGAPRDLERYAELFELSPVATLDVGFDGRVRDLNQAGSQLLGAPAAELRGRPLRACVAPDDRGRFEAYIDELCASHTRHAVELALLR